MQARILNKSEEKSWDQFIETHPLSTIHQTSAWGHFQALIPERGKYWIIVLEENNKIIGGTMLIRHKLPKGYSWLYCARGPLINFQNKEPETLLEAIKPIAKQEKAIFLRIDPPLPSSTLLTIKGFRETHHGFQPEHTLILDITKSEDEILAQMKPKGRYNIKLAEKKGIKIRATNPQNPEFPKDLAAFYHLLQETTSRDGFHGHNREFYADMLKTLSPDLAKLYLAEFNHKIIAGIIVTFFKDTATYYFGASGSEYRNLMAPYLLQWQAIKDAKACALKHYDFLGIAPLDAKNHPWLGVTEFKTKFGGAPVSYLPAEEYSFKPLPHLFYRLYKHV